MTDKKKKTWVSIVVAVLIIFVILGVAIVGGAAFWIRGHINTESVAAEVADGQFERERARFAGQQPLIELRDHDEPIIHRRAEASRKELQTVHVMAFDPEERKLVRVSLPFWLLRLAPGKRFSLGTDAGIDFDTDRVRLTVQDLERAGPGLVLDATGRRDGERVLIWTE